MFTRLAQEDEPGRAGGEARSGGRVAVDPFETKLVGVAKHGFAVALAHSVADPYRAARTEHQSLRRSRTPNWGCVTQPGRARFYAS
jgi:hypothetical protein